MCKRKLIHTQFIKFSKTKNASLVDMNSKTLMTSLKNFYHTYIKYSSNQSVSTSLSISLSENPENSDSLSG